MGALAIFVAGCFQGPPRQCSSNSDCFKGEVCRNGTCVDGETDTEEPPMDTNAPTDTGPETDTTLDSETIDTNPPEDTASDSSSPLDAADSTPSDARDTTDAPTGDTPPPTLGETCSSKGACVKGVCIKGTCSHVLGLSNTTYPGALGGMSGADTKCQNATKANNIAKPGGGNWMALISSTKPRNWAKNRLKIRAPIYNPNGDLVAKASDDVWKSLGNVPRNAIVYQVDGQVASDPEVWTGTGSQGQGKNDLGNAYPNCEAWRPSSMSSAKGVFGDSTSTHSVTWLSDDERDCSKKARIYCINGQ